MEQPLLTVYEPKGFGVYCVQHGREFWLAPANCLKRCSPGKRQRCNNYREYIGDPKRTRTTKKKKQKQERSILT